MPAVKYDISTNQGETYSVEFRLKSGSAPLDLTGATARAQVREDEYSAVALVDLKSADGDIAIDPAAGALMLTFRPEHTAAVKSTSKWDAFVYLADGQSIRVAYGEFESAATVTR